MSTLYLTPAAVNYLAQTILVGAITLYFLYLVWRTRHAPVLRRQTALLAGFLGTLGSFTAMMGLEAATLGAARLHAVNLQIPPLAVALLLLVLFAYHFPTATPRWRWEMRLIVALIGLYILWEFSITGDRFRHFMRGTVYYRPALANYPLIAGFAWAVIMLLRQAIRTADNLQRSWLRRLWHPGNQPARAARAFAIIFVTPVFLLLIETFAGFYVIPANVNTIIISVGVIGAISAFALVYLNYLPEHSTFIIKLVGGALVTILAILGNLGFLLMPTYTAAYAHREALPDHTTWRFTPTGAGYSFAVVPFSFASTLGENLALVDPEHELLALALGAPSMKATHGTLSLPFAFPFYGTTWRTIYVSDDPIVGLGNPLEPRDIRYHYGATPAIFPLMVDTAPSIPPAEAGVYAYTAEDQVTITWFKVPEFHHPPRRYTVQVVLHRDGTIDFTYNGIPPAPLYNTEDETRTVWFSGLTPGILTAPPRYIDWATAPTGGTTEPRALIIDYYRAFRQYLHQFLVPLVYALIGGSLLIFGGFPLFFRYTLITPLNALLAGIRRANAGDLTEHVPVQYHDEIGFLTASFNTMVETVRTTRAGLEQRVMARTADLAHAKDTAEEAQHAAEAANRAKSVFLANMSHELRTPLNAILGFSQLLAQDTNLTAEQRENLATIGRSGEHLLALINDVLEFSKIEAGRIELQPVNFDLYYLLRGLEEMFHLRAAQQGLLLIVERAPDIPHYIRADQNKLRQVLINLLGNAVKFTKKGSITLRVGSSQQTVDGSQQPETSPPSTVYRLLFTVEDTGVGIAPDELAQLFVSFVQTTSGRRAQEGTGLGLAISREFARLMGGELSASSVVGQGSTFQFTIPVEVVDAADLPPAALRRVIGLAPNQPQYRLLVAEDVHASRRLLVRMLQAVGFAVRAARNGAEAVHIWEEWQPHLIWMDIRMPVMDGLEATRRIKAAPGGRDTVIIATTASAFAEQRAEFLAQGCDDFLSKPFTRAALFGLLHQHLGVEFVYAETAGVAQAGSGEDTPDPAALRAQIARLPTELLTELERATIICNVEQISQLIAQIAEHDAPLADTLNHWADNFEYSRILALLRDNTA